MTCLWISRYFCSRSYIIYEQNLSRIILGIPVFRLVAMLKFLKNNFSEMHFKVGNSESGNKILEKYLQSNLHFRKLLSMNKIFEIHLWWNSFFSFPCSWLYLWLFLIYHSQNPWHQSFNNSHFRNSMFIHLVYDEDKIIYFLYIYIYFNLQVYCIKR